MAVGFQGDYGKQLSSKSKFYPGKQVYKLDYFVFFDTGPISNDRNNNQRRAWSS